MNKLFFIALLIIAACARPDMGNDVIQEGRRYVLRNGLNRDATTGGALLMDYDVTVKQNLILADSAKEIKEIKCDGTQMTFSFVKGQKIEMKEGMLVTGGDEWACAHPEHPDRKLPFHRRILSVIPTSELDTIKVQTEVVPLSEMFESAQVKYRNSIPTESKPVKFELDPAKDTKREQVPVTENTVRRSDGTNAIEELGPIYFSGETIQVKYTYDQSHSGQTFSACLKKKTILVDSKISCKDVKLSYGKGEISFPVTSSMEASSAYYVEFSRWFTSFSSNVFGINPATIILAPEANSEYYKGDKVVATWYAAPAHANKVADLSLYKTQTIGSKRIQSWSVTLSSGSIGIPVAINSLPNSADEGSYFFEITYHCFIGSSFCDLKDKSAEFMISRQGPGAKVVNIEYPVEGVVVKQSRGDVLDIKWSSNNLEGEKVKVSLCRESFGFNPCPFKSGKVDNSGKMRVKIDDWKGASTYYVVIQHSCFLFWCSSRESRRFAVNYDPQFEFVSPTPTEGVTLNAPQDLSVAWRIKSGSSVKPSQKVFVGLMARYPLFQLVFGEASTTTTADKGSLSFNVKTGSMFPVHWKISYNCKFLNWFCQSEYSPLFNIPSVYISGWNYNKDTDHAEKVIPLFHRDCTACTPDSKDVMCKACNLIPGVTANIDIQCTDCYVKTQVSLAEFELNVNLLGVTSAGLAVEGLVKANVDALIKFDAAYEFSKDIKLFFYDIIPGASINIGPIHFNLYCQFQLNTTLLFKIDGAGSISSGADASINFKVAAHNGGIKGNSMTTDFRPEFNQHKTKINLRVNVVAEVGLKPGFDVNAVDLLRLFINVNPYLQLNGKFSLPAFHPGPFPDADSFGHPGLDCTQLAHYTEYDLRFIAKCNVYAKFMTIKEWGPQTYPIIDKSLVSGCLFPSKGPLAKQAYTIINTLDELGLSQDSFKLLFLENAAKALDIDASRLDMSYPPADTTNPNAVGTFDIDVNIFQTDNQDEDVGLNTLTSIIRNTYSSFYTSSIGLKLKGKIGPKA